MKVVYLKCFENGKMYVGVTKNYNKRMREHEYFANKGSYLLVHKAMRKYTHVTLILSTCEDIEKLKELEVYWIEKLKTKIPNGYNMTDGGDGMSGYKLSDETKMKISLSRKGKYFGQNHPRAKPKEYYEKNHTTDSIFIKSCRRNNWKEDNFERVYSMYNFKTEKVLYFFIYKDSNYSWKEQKKINILKYYETNCTINTFFKIYCKNNDLQEDNFERVDSGKRNEGNRAILYNFYFKGNNYSWKKEKNRIKEIDLTFYENVPIKRMGFKNYLERLNKRCETCFKIQDFEEIDSGYRDKSHKKYFYKITVDKIKKIG